MTCIGCWHGLWRVAERSAAAWLLSRGRGWSTLFRQQHIAPSASLSVRLGLVDGARFVTKTGLSEEQTLGRHVFPKKVI